MDINSILFDNIGSKIKGVAKAIAWINIILSVIAGIILFFVAFVDFKTLWYFIFLSPVVIVIGCFMAWLSVITLYGFGELIEANCNNEKNTRNLVKLLQQNGAEKTTEYIPTEKEQPSQESVAKETTVNKSFTTQSGHDKAPEKRSQVTHKWRCDACGKMRTQSPCEYCGNQ